MIRRLLCVAASLAAGLLAVAPAGSPQDPSPSPSAAAVASEEPSGGSLLNGEKLEVSVVWRPPAYLFFIPPITAGQIVMELSEPRGGEQPPQLQVIAEARSSGTFNTLAGVRVHNRYESTIDLATGCSRQFKLARREGKRSQDVQIDFDGEAKSLRIQKWDAAKTPPAQTRDDRLAVSEACVQDLISVFYAARRLRLEPSARHSLVLCNDDGKVQEIQLKVEGAETVQTDAGRFDTYRISVNSLFGGLFRSGGEFRIWLDKKRGLPVRFESRVKFGRVNGKLTRFEPGSPVTPRTP